MTLFHIPFLEMIFNDQEHEKELHDSLRKELSNASFDKLLEIRHQIGTKEFSRITARNLQKVESGGESCSSDEETGHASNAGKGDIYRRESKSAPAEFSSKKQVGRRRKVVDFNDSGKVAVRDPRFEETSGNFNQDLFKRSYGFVNELRQNEIASLKERIASTKDVKEKSKLEKLHQKISSRQYALQRQEKREAIKRKWKKEEQAKVAEGKKKRFYLKNSEVKRLELVDQYNEMKGKDIDKYLQKKRKRNAAKERKQLPSQRTQ